MDDSLNSAQSASKSVLDKNWNDIIESIEKKLGSILSNESNESKLNAISSLEGVPSILCDFIDKVEEVISEIRLIREKNNKLEKHWINLWSSYKREAINQASKVIPLQFQEVINELDVGTLEKVVDEDVINKLKIIKFILPYLGIRRPLLDNPLSISYKRKEGTSHNIGEKRRKLNVSNDKHPTCTFYEILSDADPEGICDFLKESYNLYRFKESSSLGAGDILYLSYIADKINSGMGFNSVCYAKNLRKFELYHGDNDNAGIIFCTERSPITDGRKGLKGSLILSDKTKITKTGPAQCQSRSDGALDSDSNGQLKFHGYSRRDHSTKDVKEYLLQLFQAGFIRESHLDTLGESLLNGSNDVCYLDKYDGTNIDQIREQLAYKKNMLSLVSNMFNKPDNKSWCVIGNGDPGHHSPPAGGFCGDNLVHYFASDLDFINHVTVLDVDVNFGNGTWFLAENNHKISFHDVSDPGVWPFPEQSARTEDKSKELYSYNLKKGMSDDEACVLIDSVFENIYDNLNTKPEIINQELFVLSLGYDALNGDPQSGSRTSITVKYYQHIFSKIKELKQDFPEIKMVILPEGGYWPEKSKLLHRDLIGSLCSVDLNPKLDEQECGLF